MAMLPQARSWFLLPLIAALSLAGGYVLPRPAKKGGDMLDAVAAVQRHCPLYVTAERGQPDNWVAEGGIYLSHTSRTPEELDHLLKDSRSYDEHWAGVVYFKACGRHRERMLPFLPGPGDRILDYGDFGVYGDPDLVKEVRSILLEQGFVPAGPEMASAAQ
jgi:hypothetical protein